MMSSDDEIDLDALNPIEKTAKDRLFDLSSDLAGSLPLGPLVKRVMSGADEYAQKDKEWQYAVKETFQIVNKITGDIKAGIKVNHDDVSNLTIQIAGLTTGVSRVEMLINNFTNKPHDRSYEKALEKINNDLVNYMKKNNPIHLDSFMKNVENINAAYAQEIKENRDRSHNEIKLQEIIWRHFFDYAIKNTVEILKQTGKIDDNLTEKINYQEINRGKYDKIFIANEDQLVYGKRYSALIIYINTGKRVTVTITSGRITNGEIDKVAYFTIEVGEKTFMRIRIRDNGAYCVCLINRVSDESSDAKIYPENIGETQAIIMESIKEALIYALSDS